MERSLITQLAYDGECNPCMAGIVRKIDGNNGDAIEQGVGCASDACLKLDDKNVFEARVAVACRLFMFVSL